MSTTYTLCAHGDTVTYKIDLGDQTFDYEVCTTCRLSPDLPPLDASGPNELLPWWDWKPRAQKQQIAERPAINDFVESRVAAREQVQLLQQLIEFEKELGEESDPRLQQELIEAQEHRLSVTPMRWP